MIYAYGDSFTRGDNVDLEPKGDYQPFPDYPWAWPSRLSDIIGKPVVNRGLGGAPNFAIGMRLLLDSTDLEFTKSDILLIAPSTPERLPLPSEFPNIQTFQPQNHYANNRSFVKWFSHHPKDQLTTLLTTDMIRMIHLVRETTGATVIIFNPWHNIERTEHSQLWELYNRNFWTDPERDYSETHWAISSIVFPGNNPKINERKDRKYFTRCHHWNERAHKEIAEYLARKLNIV